MKGLLIPWQLDAAFQAATPTMRVESTEEDESTAESEPDENGSS
jgi:hypothetical protein